MQPDRWQKLDTLSPPLKYVAALVACAATALVSWPLRPFLDLANIVMLFLLAVFLCATLLGRGPAVSAVILSVAAFDFFFVPPQLSFAVADAQYLVTFGVMLAVGLITAHLVSRLAEQTAQARTHERETRQLYEVARHMAAAQTFEQVFQSVRGHLNARQLDANLLLTDADGALADLPGGHHRLSAMELTFARSACQRNEVVETDSLAGLGISLAFFPLRVSDAVRGVLAVSPRDEDTARLRTQRRALQALASLAALAVERLQAADTARRAELQIAEERLRTSVLSSLSHDLRTPLTTLVGLADSLVQRDPAQPAPRDAEIAETAAIIRDQSHAMHRLLTDLLDMARLQGNRPVLRREWQPFDDVVGSSLRLAERARPDHQVTVDLAPDLPLVSFDPVLIERVLCNLLDNAFKYAPPGASIHLGARIDGSEIRVSVCNEGSAFPADRLDTMFDLFVRGQVEPSTPGVGLGLAICKVIVTAHGGTIHAENAAGRACVHFTLPAGTPPPVLEETA